MKNIERTRNFCIIAHIDHGKSTLADRLLDITEAVPERERMAQILDTMDIERERGITIKAQAVRVLYRRGDGEWTLNLIDTPGHVDFAYEVSRAIAACEGALLIVDASQGIQAQTLANLYLAMEHDLEIIPVLNKIDLPIADVPAVTEELVELLGVDEEDIMKISAKTGEGVTEVLDAIVDRSPPRDHPEETRGLVFDSYYDPYRGVISLVRLVDGELKKGEGSGRWDPRSGSSSWRSAVTRPSRRRSRRWHAGEVGYVIAGLKDIEALRVGDTVTRVDEPGHGASARLRSGAPDGLLRAVPDGGGRLRALKEALAKLQLNDASLFFEPENSRMGFGFRCGFLGLLHMEIIQERLEREFDLDLIASSPSVRYEVVVDGEVARSPTRATCRSSSRRSGAHSQGDPDLPRRSTSARSWASATSGAASRSVWSTSRRAGCSSPTTCRWRRSSRLFDALKSRTRGYASYDYEFKGYEPADLVKVEVLVSGSRSTRSRSSSTAIRRITGAGRS